MEYTEVPTHLLVEVEELVSWIVHEHDRALEDVGVALAIAADSFLVKFTVSDMEHMQPLIKWLEYIKATWIAGEAAAAEAMAKEVKANAS